MPKNLLASPKRDIPPSSSLSSASKFALFRRPYGRPPRWLVDRDDSRGEHWFDFVIRREGRRWKPLPLARPRPAAGAAATEYVVFCGIDAMPVSPDELCCRQFSCEESLTSIQLSLLNGKLYGTILLRDSPMKTPCFLS